MALSRTRHPADVVELLIETLRALSHVLYSPLTWGLLLAALLAWRWHAMGRALRVTGMLAGVLLLLLCAPLGANLLVLAIERAAPSGADCGALRDAPVVVLTGGFERPPRAVDDYAALHEQSWRRVRGAVDWLRAHPGHVLWVSGGGPYEVREADVVAGLARDWGVAPDALHIERDSTTTWSSAQALRGRLPPKIVLVTAALHMPRALIAYRHAGFDPCPAPSASQYLAPRSPAALVPQTSAMYKTEEASYEVVGLLYYALRSLGGRDADDDAAR